MKGTNTVIWAIIIIFCVFLVSEGHVFAGQLNNVDAYITDWAGTEYLVRDIYPDNYPNTCAFYARHENSTITLPLSNIRRIMITDRFLLSYSEYISERQYHCVGKIILKDNKSFTCSWSPNGWKGCNNYGGDIFIGRNYWKEIRFSDSGSTKFSAVSSDLGPYPYTVHVSSFRDKYVSYRVAMNLRNKGIPAFACPTQIPGKGKYYRVFIGFYRTFQETRKAALGLRGKKDLYPLEAKMPYAIQFGTFDSDQELQKLETDLQSKYYLAYTIPDISNMSRTRLLMGAFRAEKDSEELVKALQAEGFSPSVVIR